MELESRRWPGTAVDIQELYAFWVFTITSCLLCFNHLLKTKESNHCSWFCPPKCFGQSWHEKCPSLTFIRNAAMGIRYHTHTELKQLEALILSCATVSFITILLVTLGHLGVIVHKISSCGLSEGPSLLKYQLSLIKILSSKETAICVFSKLIMKLIIMCIFGYICINMGMCSSVFSDIITKTVSAKLMFLSGGSEVCILIRSFCKHPRSVLSQVDGEV